MVAVNRRANITGFGDLRVWLSPAFVFLQLDLRKNVFFAGLKLTIPIIINALSK